MPVFQFWREAKGANAFDVNSQSLFFNYAIIKNKQAKSTSSICFKAQQA